jgi:hypothetical protein
MVRNTPPLFGSDWSDNQIKRFEETKSEYLGMHEYTYWSAEAVLAFLTFRVLSKMILTAQPQECPALIRIQDTAVEIVCHRLCGDQPRAEAPVLHRRETAPPEPMEPYREQLLEMVKYWLDVDSEDVRSEINPDYLRRLKDALGIAQADQKAIKQARRRR